MSIVRISPDIPPQNTYDPADDIIAGARLIPGFLDVRKDIYYREWVIDFSFDDKMITETDVWKQISALQYRFSGRWGKPK